MGTKDRTGTGTSMPSLSEPGGNSIEEIIPSPEIFGSETLSIRCSLVLYT